jgi:hypothetical protein
MNNFTMFNDIEGIYMYTFPTEKKDDCPICSNAPRHIQMHPTDKFQGLVDLLLEK